ncbi:thioredoxin [Desulfobulbus rhabdoformis]|uniref:thioredoxin n=1 Tax=Desulfobulbus rhabdoformis TaxID=34032 RepID=UPI0019641D9F|nr:thioredoxin [Desulfobulbus rhabdoformis]MBM9616683.1 thioredoxin [Desulfobulbus rhabdoformis]
MNTVIVCPQCGAKNRIPEDKQHLTPKCGKCGTSLDGAPISGKVNSLTDGGFNALVEQSKLPVLLDFFSPTCGPCQMIAPAIEALAQEYTGKLLVFKMDTSTQQMTAARFQIRGVPTLLFIKNGEVVDQLVGAAPRGDIEQRIQNIVG